MYDWPHITYTVIVLSKLPTFCLVLGICVFGYALQTFHTRPMIVGNEVWVLQLEGIMYTRMFGMRRKYL